MANTTSYLTSGARVDTFVSAEDKVLAPLVRKGRTELY